MSNLSLVRTVLLGLLIAAAGCKKGNNGVPISTVSILAVVSDSICTWKNGVGTALTSGNTASTAMAVCVHGSDVYVAGYTWTAGTNYVACYWKNGAIVNITDGSSSAIAYSIAVE